MFNRTGVFLSTIIGLGIFMVSLTSCASTYRAMQTFAFDMSKDNQQAVVLDFKYLANQVVLAQKIDYQVGKEEGGDAGAIGGVMPLGTSLYVKWRSTNTNEIRQETVDLRPFLIKNIEFSTIYFMILDSHLFVYQISPHVDGAPRATVGPENYRYQNVHQVYPPVKQ